MGSAAESSSRTGHHHGTKSERGDGMGAKLLRIRKQLQQSKLTIPYAPSSCVLGRSVGNSFDQKSLGRVPWISPLRYSGLKALHTAIGLVMRSNGSLNDSIIEVLPCQGPRPAGTPRLLLARSSGDFSL